MTRHRIVTARRLADLHAVLTPPDWQVLATLRKVRVATGLQLQRLHHGDDDAAKQRRIRQLTRLSRLQVITRLERRIGGVTRGSMSSVYTLDVAGLRLLDFTGQARTPWTPSTPFVAHAVAVTELYVQLTATDRASRLELVRFDAEPRCWRQYTDRSGDQLIIKPDADVVLGVGEFEHHWWIEIDLSTESRPRLTAKARQYVDFYSTGQPAAERGVNPRVL